MAEISKPEKCPVCENGNWIAHSDGVHRFKHKRRQHAVPGLQYSLCDHCGCRGFTEEQAELNQHAIAEYERKLPDFISPSDIYAIREKYGISQAQAAKIFNCGIAYFSKWERGEVAPTGPAVTLLKNAFEHTDFMRRLCQSAGISIPALDESAKPQEAQISATAKLVHKEGDSYLLAKEYALSRVKEVKVIAYTRKAESIMDHVVISRISGHPEYFVMGGKIEPTVTPAFLMEDENWSMPWMHIAETERQRSARKKIGAR